MNDTSRMEIAVYPLGTGDSSISREVSRIFDVLDTCNLTFNVTPLGTIVEGSPGELFELAQRLHEIVFSDTVKRVVTVMKIDERR